MTETDGRAKKKYMVGQKISRKLLSISIFSLFLATR